jgi:hypothetical protein
MLRSLHMCIMNRVCFEPGQRRQTVDRRRCAGWLWIHGRLKPSKVRCARDGCHPVMYQSFRHEVDTHVS